MGALYSGRCYATASDAADAAWSGVGPVVAGSPPIVSTVEFSSGWFLVTRDAGVVTSSVGLDLPAFAQCDPGASVADGVTLGFLLVAVWFAAWGVAYLANVVRSRA